MTPKTRVGLALGGGGARGWAHIGVIQALLIQPDLGDVHFLEFQRARKTIARGYKAARLALKGSPWC